jgi:hypothetical protein
VSNAATLAHQGGWDEILFVLLPIAMFAGLLAVANRRATREQASRKQAEQAEQAGAEHEHDRSDVPD